MEGWTCIKTGGVPDAYITVLVWAGDSECGDYVIAFYDGTVWLRAADHYILDDVTHWMDLPEEP